MWGFVHRVKGECGKENVVVANPGEDASGGVVGSVSEHEVE